ncbi:MAG: hypothetical protein ACTHJR_03870 [Sphingomonas sp.]|uniref:hypothetical protein n=1 Tax=Sphingomonas sp. TaxID=28214 RepID=UPI003F7F0357
MMEDVGMILIAIAIALMLVPPIHMAIVAPPRWIVADIAPSALIEQPPPAAKPDLSPSQADATIARVRSGARLRFPDPR